MRVAYTPTYGPASILEFREMPKPDLAEGDVLVQVYATPVTEGDRRLRSADFPGMSALPGRLAMGISGPRAAVQGSMFAGRVVEVGASVTQYRVGDDVFGSTDSGAYAEFLRVPSDGPMAKLPANMSHAEAAAVPYGAGTALHFLRDVAQVKSGDKVLVLGASGGVGRFAVQLARHMGAEVTGVCSEKNTALVSALGADHVIDYGRTDFTQNGQHYDVIFDIAGATSFGRCRSSLTASGRYLTVYVSVGVLVQMAWTALVGGKRALFALALGDQEQMAELRELMKQGVLDPVIAERFHFEQMVDAHRAAEARRSTGAVVVAVAQPTPLRAVG